ncbi:t-SNARE domain-containing protein 1-like [Hyla sarda]|uniref:t-SNARE domain-containing protein 1-like n=1 Tax=Hyla sarda TaxID=327740 RepID=UPI0024C21F36|nr:t-SNARE domain-containing protein 1-like [Hyla sarda]
MNTSTVPGLLQRQGLQRCPPPAALELSQPHLEGTEEGVPEEAEYAEDEGVEETADIRKKRFTAAEKHLHVVEVKANYDQLYGRISDKLPKANKTRIWREICSKVNALGVAKRSVANIIHKWYDCKRQVKEKLKKIDQHSKQTGGGPAIKLKLCQTEEIVADTFRREQISGIGSFDVMAGIEDSSDGDELITESPGPSSIVSQQDSSTLLPSGQHISEEDTIHNLSQKLTQYISKNVKQGEMVQVLGQSSSIICQ